MLSAPVNDTNNEMTRSSAAPSRQPAPELRSPAAGMRGHSPSHAGAISNSWQLMPQQAFAKAQSAYGNQAILRALNHSTNLSAPCLQRKCACAGSGADCASCNEKKESTLQRKAANPAEPGGVPAIVHEVLRSPGRPLDAHTRAFMESRFGYDFGGVRIHTDSRAAESARAVNALAYTVGRNLVFGAGEYSPNSVTGKVMIAHELTHVVQQASGPSVGAVLRVGDPGDQLERQADDLSSRLVAGPISSESHNHALPMFSGDGHTIQRQAARRSHAATRSHGAPVIENGQLLGAGQMHRAEFLHALHDRVIQACNIEFAAVGRAADRCPVILRTIERYATRPLSSLLRLIGAFAHPPAGADAQGLINAVTERARLVARRIAARHGPRLQSKPENESGLLTPHDPNTIRRQLGGGHRLESSVRERMEVSFGASFAGVKVHRDSTAARLNAALGARAFTIGSDIAFGAGEYQPGTLPGDSLIAHELAHTIQQDSGMSRSASGDNDRELERQADRAASAAVAGHEGAATSLTTGEGGLRIQRLPVVLAGALIVAEATPEIVIAAEIGSEVVLVDGALTVGAEVAVPAAVDALAPAAVDVTVSTLAPAAVDVAAVSSSSAVSTTVAATAIGATTLSSDSPTEDEEEQQDCQGPIGYTPFDAIPITWFKPFVPDYYPTPIEIGGTYYDRDDPTQHLPLGEPIGVNAAYRPYLGKTVQLDPVERGPGAERFRAVLERYGFDWSGLQADHVQDLQWSGDDVFDNLWPMDRSANLSAGPRQNDNQVVTFCETRRGPQRTMSLRQMKAAGLTSQYFGRWFAITRFQR